jgi:hypothetical protein
MSREELVRLLTQALNRAEARQSLVSADLPPRREAAVGDVLPQVGWPERIDPQLRLPKYQAPDTIHP